MGRKLTSNLYVEEDIKYFPKEHTQRYVKLPDNRLYASTSRGFWATKVTKEDLPEYYIYGQYYKRFGWLNCRGIKDVKYRPFPYVINHTLKDDTLFISYDKPIVEDKNCCIANWYTHDEYVYGTEIIDILKGMRDYGGWDIQPIIEEIWQKMLTLKQLDGTTDDGFFDKYVGSREKFDGWWK